MMMSWMGDIDIRMKMAYTSFPFTLPHFLVLSVIFAYENDISGLLCMPLFRLEISHHQAYNF